MQQRLAHWMCKPLLGELLGLAFLTKAFALWRLPVARRIILPGLTLGAGARCPRPQSPHVDRYCGTNNCLNS